MRLFRYWAREALERENRHKGTIRALGYGYSDTSRDAALVVARELAEAQLDRIEKRLDHPPAPTDPGQYYPATVRPLREEIIETLTHDERRVAIISRNSYGSLILNTSEVFFADVDAPAKRTAGGFWKWITGGSGDQPGTFEEQLVNDIQHLVMADSRLCLRLYRTLAGYRIAIMSQTIPATSALSHQLLTRLGSDRLYVSLCQSQDSYRARLTPKPWRMGMSRPPVRFPWRDADDESRQRKWESRYDQSRRKYSACLLVGEYGSSVCDPMVSSVIQVHDMFCLSETVLPLA